MHQQNCQVHETATHNFHISALLGPQSPLTARTLPSEASSCSAGEEIACLLRNTKPEPDKSILYPHTQFLQDPF
jgi:hypothetical protein